MYELVRGTPLFFFIHSHTYDHLECLPFHEPQALTQKIEFNSIKIAVSNPLKTNMYSNLFLFLRNVLPYFLF